MAVDNPPQSSRRGRHLLPSRSTKKRRTCGTSLHLFILWREFVKGIQDHLCVSLGLRISLHPLVLTWSNPYPVFYEHRAILIYIYNYIYIHILIMIYIYICTYTFHHLHQNKYIHVIIYYIIIYIIKIYTFYYLLYIYI